MKTDYRPVWKNKKVTFIKVKSKALEILFPRLFTKIIFVTVFKVY